MCGIVGCILKNNKNAAPVLLDCISNWNIEVMIQ